MNYTQALEIIESYMGKFYDAFNANDKTELLTIESWLANATRAQEAIINDLLTNDFNQLDITYFFDAVLSAEIDHDRGYKSSDCRYTKKQVVSIAKILVKNPDIVIDYIAAIKVETGINCEHLSNNEKAIIKEAYNKAVYNWQVFTINKRIDEAYKLNGVWWASLSDAIKSELEYIATIHNINFEANDNDAIELTDYNLNHEQIVELKKAMAKFYLMTIEDLQLMERENKRSYRMLLDLYSEFLRDNNEKAREVFQEAIQALNEL